MAGHHLAVMPFEVDPAVLAHRLDTAGVGDVAGLYAVDAEALIKVERRRELRFVMRDVAEVS